MIENLDIDGNILIDADNVTLRNIKLTTDDFNGIQVMGGATGFTLMDSEIDGSGTAHNGILGEGTFLRNNIYGAENGLTVYGPSEIRDNYIHGLAGDGGSHYDAIEINGGHNIQILHNTVINENTQTSAIMLDNWAGGLSNIKVDGNYLEGGGYTVYLDDRFGGGAVDDASISITNNQVGGGYYGDFALYGNNPVMSGNVGLGETVPATAEGTIVPQTGESTATPLTTTGTEVNTGVTPEAGSGAGSGESTATVTSGTDANTGATPEAGSGAGSGESTATVTSGTDATTGATPEAGSGAGSGESTATVTSGTDATTGATPEAGSGAGSGESTATVTSGTDATTGATPEAGSGAGSGESTATVTSGTDANTGATSEAGSATVSGESTATVTSGTDANTGATSEAGSGTVSGDGTATVTSGTDANTGATSEAGSGTVSGDGTATVTSGTDANISETSESGSGTDQVASGAGDDKIQFGHILDKNSGVKQDSHHFGASEFEVSSASTGVHDGAVGHGHEHPIYEGGYEGHNWDQGHASAASDWLF
ncbi:hypothetical protein [Sinorhizobium meliloti]|uniref:hypothetical protein n=1 Tax=Rhizobium meliloti TaxID=382 RepID=UPI0023805EAD|nr:hypothetical protein [Sinorhizobium meliloti]MDE3816107.1 hypothetical protein [Sinorhizobium meliloti]